LELHLEYDCLPKINTFCWTMIHGNILTEENIKKRGIHGPSHHELCSSNEEYIQHFFLNVVSLNKFGCALMIKHIGNLHQIVIQPFITTIE
jgi:hypothetical protein